MYKLSIEVVPQKVRTNPGLDTILYARQRMVFCIANNLEYELGIQPFPQKHNILPPLSISSPVPYQFNQSTPVLPPIITPPVSPDTSSPIHMNPIFNPNAPYEPIED